MRLHLFFLFLLHLCTRSLLAQNPYAYSLSKTNHRCVPAEAFLEIKNLQTNDSITLSWSTGEQNVTRINGLKNGEHSVNVRIKHHDSLTRYYDTTLVFYIDKEECPVAVSKFFTPNDDNYNDVMSITNVDFFPEFELEIFNKWGQRVHHQKHSYTPWDGKWNGIDLPDGTYYYVFFYSEKNKKQAAKGDVTILR